MGIIRRIELARGVGTGEASEARASPEIRAFTREILRSWICEVGNFLCFTGKKLVPTPLLKWNLFLKQDA